MPDLKAQKSYRVFLASQDALEVMLVTVLLTYLLSHWWLAMTLLMWPWWVMIPKEDLTGVILVSEDGFWRLDWCDSGYWGGFLETWLMWLWLLRRPFRDLTDVTLVSADILRRLDWCDSGVWGCLLETWLMWPWWVMIPKEDLIYVFMWIFTCWCVSSYCSSFHNIDNCCWAVSLP